MSDSIAITFLALLAAYFAAGICFAFAFVFRGISFIDPGAAHAPIGFRVILIPGATALWPWLLRRWLRPSKEANL